MSREAFGDPPESQEAPDLCPVRGGVWDPNGLMDEHMAALRKALGPNAEFTGIGRNGVSSDH